jgi:hypothetical protein
VKEYRRHDWLFSDNNEASMHNHYLAGRLCTAPLISALLIVALLFHPDIKLVNEMVSIENMRISKITRV